MSKTRLTDWGEPEYLDGAMMQFMVTEEAENSIGKCLGYFGRREDAELFIAVKNDTALSRAREQGRAEERERCAKALEQWGAPVFAKHVRALRQPDPTLEGEG